MAKLLKLEKITFYFFIAVSFWQWRLVWPRLGEFNEWTAFFLYATDMILAAIFILWGIRNILPILPFVKGETRSGEGFKSSARPAIAGRSTSFTKGGINRLSDLIFRPNIFLYLFLIISALSLFAAPDKALGFYRLVKLLEFVGLFFYVKYNFTALYSLKRFWQWFLAGAVLQSAVAVAQFLTQRSLGLKFFAESPLAPNIDSVAKLVVNGDKFIRAYGLVPHPNILAAMLVVAIFGAVWLWLSDNKNICHAELVSASKNKRSRNRFWMTMKNIIFIVVFVLLSVALFFTFSRGVIIVGGISFLLWLSYLWLKHKDLRRAIFSVILLFAISFSLLAFIYWPFVVSRFNPTTLPSSQSLDLRSFYNLAAWDVVKSSPWLGIGSGNFVVALRNAFVLPDWQYQPAHNIYLLLAAENGWPALLAFLAFLFLTLKATWPRKIRFAHHGAQPCISNNLLFVACFLLLIGFFDHFLWDLQQGQILFWLMLGLLAAVTSKNYAEKI